jgi:hypothetical protein
MNVDPEGGLHVHCRNWSAITLEDLRAHTQYSQYYPQSWKGPSAAMSSVAEVVASYIPPSKAVRRAEEAEMDERNEASGSVFWMRRGG